MREHGRRHSIRSRALAAVLVVLTLASGIAGCSAAPAPAPPPTNDIRNLSDNEVSAQLAAMLPDVQRALADPGFLATADGAQLAALDGFVNDMGSDAGRRSIISGLRTRAAADQAPTGWPGQDVAVRNDNPVFAPPDPPAPVPPPATGVRSQPGTQVLQTEPAVTGASGACGAPDGAGTLLRSDAAPGSILTPAHEVWTTGPDPTFPLGGWGAVGVGGPGIEYRLWRNPATPAAPAVRQLHVQVNLDSSATTGIPAGALTVLFDATPLRALDRRNDVPLNGSLSDARIYCYANDSSPNHAYFDGWITVSRNWTEPGVQLSAEVVENDNWFAFFRNGWFNNTFDLALSIPGPGLWLGADRSTLHVGPAPISTTDPVPRAAGVFATAVADGSADPGVNLLTDTNGVPGDDLERSVRSVVDSTVRSTLSGYLLDHSKTLFTKGTINGLPATWADNVAIPDYDAFRTQVDTRYVGISDGLADLGPLGPNISGGPGVPSRALQARVSTTPLDLKADVTILLTGRCHVAIHVEPSITANAWVESKGNTSALAARAAVNAGATTASLVPDTSSLSVIAENTLNALTCALTQVAWWAIGEGKVKDSLGGAVRDAFGYTSKQVDGQEVQVPGAVTRILDSLDLNSVLHDRATLSLPPGPTTSPQTQLVPSISNIDNAWCRPFFTGLLGATDGESACTTGRPLPGVPGNDLDLLGTNGPALLGDGTIGSGQAAPGVILGGRFPNVYRPSVDPTTLAQIANTHMDAGGRMAAVGAALDPALLNLSLRHLAQGPAVTVGQAPGSSTQTNGLLDQSVRVDAFSATVTTTPRVAPIVLNLPPGTPTITTGGVTLPPSSPLVRVVLPDVEVRVKFDNDSVPMVFSVTGSVDLGLEQDPSGSIRPRLASTVVVDAFLNSGCKVDYVHGYAASYAVCGRGVQYANGGTTPTFTGVISWLVSWSANQLSTLVTDTIGAIHVPDIDGILPDAHLRPGNIRFAQIGGYLTLMADVAAAPWVRLTAVPATATVRFDWSAESFSPAVAPTYDVRITDKVAQRVLFQATATPTTGVTLPVGAFTTDVDGTRHYRYEVSVTATQVVGGVTRTASATLPVDVARTTYCPPTKPCNNVG